MNKLIVTGAMAFVMLCAMSTEASAWNRYNYGHGGYGYGHGDRSRGGVVSRSIENVARTVRRIERALTGPTHSHYRPAPVFVRPVYVPVRQHRPMYRRDNYW
jgi:hypothetical protein